MTFNLEWISPAQLREYWPIIKPGVNILDRLTKEWISEDIYFAIKSGSCNLHYGTFDGEYIGFIVIQKRENYGVISLHVWAAYSEAHDFNMLHLASDQFKEWGKQIGAKKITFSSHRKGWARQALKIGFKASPSVTYEMEL